MTKAKDCTGVRFGRIVGLRPTEKRRNNQVVWVWKCDCGEEFEQVAGNFWARSNSAGCPICVKKATIEKAAYINKTHGMSKSKEYKSWAKIKERCFCETCFDFPQYGGKGISMDETWRNDFQSFLDHIGLIPTDGKHYSCDRIDRDLGYFPGNVRWATDEMQARNRGMQKNNKTGTTGVKLDEKSPGNIYYVATWYNLSGKQKTFSASIKKYGEELARFLAEEKRDVEICRLNLLGAGYSETHGK